MITPYEDKIAIKAILDTDGYIQDAGFEPQKIYTKRYNPDALSSTKADLQIFIYEGLPANSGNWMQRGEVYNVCIYGETKYQNRIDNVSQQIIALLTDADLGRGHISDLYDPPMQLESDHAIYAVEVSFVVHATIFNPIKH